MKKNHVVIVKLSTPAFGLLIYKTGLSPIVEHASLMCNCLTENDIDKTEKMQEKNYLRFTCNRLGHCSIRALIAKANLSALSQTRGSSVPILISTG